MRLFKKGKPRVYLNSIFVVKLDEDLNFLERLLSPEYKEIDTRLETLLKEAITLPHVSERQNALDSDLGMDIVVPDYQSGGIDAINLGYGGIPLWWRPRVKIASRLFKIDSNETLKEFAITQKMGWRHFFLRVFHIRTFFGHSGFYPEDFEFLMINACYKLVNKMRKAV